MTYTQTVSLHECIRTWPTGADKASQWDVLVGIQMCTPLSSYILESLCPQLFQVPTMSVFFPVTNVVRAEEILLFGVDGRNQVTF